MKFSSKTKFKLNKLEKNSSNSCNQQMSPYYVPIVTDTFYIPVNYIV